MIVRVPRVDVQGIKAVSMDTGKQEEAHDKVGVEDAWDLRSLETSFEYVDPDKANYQPQYYITAKIQRKSYYYVINICLPNALLVLLNFSVFFLNTKDLVDRLSIILAILLTGVTFKLGVAGKFDLSGIRHLTNLTSFSLA